MNTALVGKETGTGLVPHKKFAVVINERPYPFINEFRDKLPGKFGEIPAAIMQRHMQTPKMAGKPKSAIFHAYTSDLKTLGEYHQQCIRFFKRIVRSNTYAKGPGSEVIADRINVLIGKVSGDKFIGPGTLRAELAIRPEAEVIAILLQSVEDLCRVFVEWIVEVLDRLVLLEQVGVIGWFDATVCRYHFFQHVFSEEQRVDRTVKKEQVGDNGTARQFRETVDEETHHTRTVSHEKYVEDLVDATKSNPRKYQRPMPGGVRHLIDALPSFLDDWSAIISGMQIAEFRTQAVQKEEWTEQSTSSRVFEEVYVFPPQEVYRPDPCLSLCHFAISGWNDDILEQEARERNAEVSRINKEYQQGGSVIRWKREEFHKEIDRFKDRFYFTFGQLP